MVSMWFKNETNLVTMTELLKRVEEELEKAAYKIHGKKVKEAGNQASEEALDKKRKLCSSKSSKK